MELTLQRLNGKLSTDFIAEVPEDFGNEEHLSQVIIPAAWCLNEMQLKFIQSIIEDGNGS
ncbi:hypothetical protein [Erwinia sp. SLM-02]|uniref:hypothetical protein n=1 Tax=Erwinia sp. SLM-02 TaxID=3020057 RepID=UPI0028D8C443|nr:hypothetical protein [uncultured Erwinia sp.]